jgi:cytochrome o ubiquinol oxidase subunit II
MIERGRGESMAMQVTPLGLPSPADYSPACHSFPGRRVACCATLIALLGLTACQAAVLDPRGPVALADRTILLDSLAIMLAIVLPTIAATLGVAWWYRASNTRARYRPDWAYSGQLEMIVWSIPLLTIILLGGVAWVGSHDLDPSKKLPSSSSGLDVQVVSFDWKWLFIYPGQHVASVNELFVPAGVPVHFDLTSASVMSAFFVPQLGSMIYTMNGMATELNLRADYPGTFYGLSSHYNGDGFSDMHFAVQALPADRFAAWVESAQTAGPALNEQSYAELAKQSVNVSPFTYRDADPDLFQKIVTQAVPPGPGPTDETNPGTSRKAEK